MKIYVVSAVDIDADYPYNATDIAYYLSEEKALKRAEEITKEYEEAKANGWYSTVVDPESGMSHEIAMSQYQSEGNVYPIEVIE